ncbi:hypothetical protein C8R44DRAFT_871357 [Mycena epipterygia]|nr:hypothetical protein C8R44DRAFT_871357 [Mycena epipterygia]
MQLFTSPAALLILVLGAIASSVLGQEDIKIAARIGSPVRVPIKPPTTSIIKFISLSGIWNLQPPATSVIKPPTTSVIKPLPTPHCPPLPCRPLVERRACVQGRCVDVEKRIECPEEDSAIVCLE